MQTFLPSSSFHECARVLDRQRLGKQRVECLQILRALAGLTRGWVNHPCTKMWRGYEHSLLDYAEAVCSEWVARGYRDNCREKMLALMKEHFSDRPRRFPHWLGSPSLHASYQSVLIRKNPDHYRPLWPDTPDDLTLVWPEGASA